MPILSFFGRAAGFMGLVTGAEGGDATPVSAANPLPTTATLSSDTIGAGLVPKYAVIAASSSGNNEIVAAVATKKIRVLGYVLMGAGAVNAKFRSADSADRTGLHYIAAAGGGASASFNPVGWFETVAGEALNLNLSGAVAVGGVLVYIEV